MAAHKGQTVFVSDSYFKSEFLFHVQFQFKINLKLNFKFISNSVSFENQFKFYFILIFYFKLSSKAFLFYFVFKNLIWACSPPVPIPTLYMVFWQTFKSAVNHWSDLNSNLATKHGPLRPITPSAQSSCLLL